MIWKARMIRDEGESAPDGEALARPAGGLGGMVSGGVGKGFGAGYGAPYLPKPGAVAPGVPGSGAFKMSAQTNGRAGGGRTGDNQPESGPPPEGSGDPPENPK